jgi:hypothetical protein
MVVLLAVILVVVMVFPSLGAWPLLLLFLEGVVERALARRDKVPQD